ITVTSEGKSAVATITVSAPAPAPVASVTVSPATASLLIGATVQLSVTAFDASNNVLTGRVIAWSSSNTAVASVNGSGVVTAVAAGSAQITATSEGKSGSAALSVVAPPPPPPPGTVEPLGMNVITERSFSAVAEDGWSVPTGSDLTNFTVVSDATAPKSAPLAMQIRFPAGFGAGGSPALTERDLGSTASTLYVSMWIKLSSNWVGQITGTNKVLHFWMAGLNRLFVFVDGAGNNILQPYVGLQGIATPYNNGAGSTSTSVNLRPNVVGQTGAQIVRGQWYHWELVFAINSSGSTDGTADWWINGVQVGHYTGIGYVSASQSRVFQTMKWDPTWGGLGGTVPADQFMTMDHIYISGKP
ncbi:MAG TPA: Ig-like domain-containing protein, partial [Gemmatimonadaceae bacterium]